MTPAKGRCRRRGLCWMRQGGGAAGSARGDAVWRWWLSASEVFEPVRRQLGVTHRVLDVSVTEIGLQRPSIVPLIRQSEAAGVTKHMRVGLELEACRRASTLHKPRKACPW